MKRFVQFNMRSRPIIRLRGAKTMQSEQMLSWPRFETRTTRSLMRQYVKFPEKMKTSVNR
jgi:hypothetical protein